MERTSPREELRMTWCHRRGRIARARVEAERYAKRTFKEELGKVRDFARRKASDGTYRRTAFLKSDFCLCDERGGL